MNPTVSSVSPVRLPISSPYPEVEIVGTGFSGGHQWKVTFKNIGQDPSTDEPGHQFEYTNVEELTPTSLKMSRTGITPTSYRYWAALFRDGLLVTYNHEFPIA